MAELPGYEFTLCKVADESRSTAKRIVGKDDGSYQKFDYDNVKKWFFAPKAVPGHAAMASLLGKLALRCDVMLVMGAPRPGLDLSRSQLRRAVERPGEPATLVAEPRAWLPLDCDGYAVPAPWGRAEHLKDAARAVRDDALGEEFADVACVVAATSQTGLVGEETARLRLLFLLDRLHPLAELENWAKGARVVGLPVDASVFQAQQPIYTARPRFEGALAGHDLVPARLRAFVLPGRGERVTLDVTRHEARRQEIVRRVSKAAAGCGGDWRTLLEATLGGPASFFEPLSQALGVAALSSDNGAEIVRFCLKLIDERADPGRRRQYSRRWLEQSLARFRKVDRGRAERIEQRLAAMFSGESEP